MEVFAVCCSLFLLFMVGIIIYQNNRHLKTVKYTIKVKVWDGFESPEEWGKAQMNMYKVINELGITCESIEDNIDEIDV